MDPVAGGAPADYQSNSRLRIPAWFHTRAVTWQHNLNDQENMAITTQQKQNGKAEELCRIIGQQQESFVIHGFRYSEYDEDDMARIRTINRFFGLKTVYQCIILCFFIDRKISDDSAVTWKEITQHFSLSLEACVRLNSTIQTLVTRRMISFGDSYRNSRNCWTLSAKCLNALLTYRRFTRPRRGNFIDGFLKEFDQVMMTADDFGNEENFRQLCQVIDEYQELPELKWLKRQTPDRQHAAIFFMVFRDHVFFRRTASLEKILNIVSNEPFIRYDLERSMKSSVHPLIREDLLCFEADFFTSDNLKITARSMEELSNLSPGLDTPQKKSFQPKFFELIQPDEIVKENYLHNDPNLRLIEKTLARESYGKVKEQMPSLAYLLYGSPGTGKSSFVRWVAQKTGRPILTTNIAKILSSFVGASENNLVALFDEAKKAFDAFSDNTPICVFDEAEALLHSRNVQSRTAADHMTNNMISLLLPQLDSFRGIAFFMTNFRPRELDPALNRRFHQVVHIKSPAGPVMRAIFRSRFPEFTDEDAGEFISRYRISTPAEIEKLRRRHTVHMLVNEETNSRGVLCSVADLELAEKSRRNAPIGFRLPEIKKT
jgi:hypothetical protein